MDRAADAPRDTNHGSGSSVFAESASGLTRPRAVAPTPGLFKELLLHLVKRELDSTHRMTILGWAWPLVRQLMQLAVLVFIFGSVLDLNIENFPVFVFSGLVAWTWFSTGVSTATTSVITEKHLLYYPRLPPAVISVVSVFVPLVDVLMALPVLAALVVLESDLQMSALGLPVLIIVQMVL